MKRISDFFSNVDSKYFIDEKGEIYDSKQQKIVKQFFYKDIFRVELEVKDYPYTKLFYTSMLVNFIYNGAPKKTTRTPTTAFIDGNKKNLHYTNLMWVSRAFNEDGDYLKYSRVEQKIEKSDIIDIFDMYKEGKTFQEISKKYNVNWKYIYKILSGRKRLSDLKELNLEPLIKSNKRTTIAEIWNICETLSKNYGNIKQTRTDLGYSDSIIRSIYNRENHKNVSQFYDFDNGHVAFENSDEFSVFDENIVKVGETEFIFKED
jgi:hypothetical protein